LQRSSADLFGRNWRIEIEKSSDISAHVLSPHNLNLGGSDPTRFVHQHATGVNSRAPVACINC